MKTLVFISLMMTSVAQAQFSLDSAKAIGTQVATACKNESVRFCKEKAMDKLKACLEENFSKLSDGCKAALKAGK